MGIMTAESEVTANNQPTTLAQRVAEIAPIIAERARDTERAGRVPEENMQLLREIGYFDVVKPARFGGAPTRFSELVEANIDLSAACASTGWVAGLTAAHQWFLAMFPIQAQKDVWDNDPNALLCGSYAPTTMAERVEGGYKLNGRWAFASGCDNAQWALCAVVLPGKDRQKPAPAFTLVPQSDYEKDEDSWDVNGLIGTGSKTLILEEVFVPEHRVATFAQTTTGKTPGAEIYADQPLFNMPLLTGIPSCLSGTAVGAAQGALQSYMCTVAERTTRGAVAGGHNKMIEFQAVQLRVGRAAACVDAAREVLLRDVDYVQNIAGTAVEFPLEQRIRSRRGQAFAVSLALEAADALNGAIGGAGLQMSHPVQRAWRDCQAVGRHISMNWDAVGSMAGQFMLGLEPQGQY